MHHSLVQRLLLKNWPKAIGPRTTAGPLTESMRQQDQFAMYRDGPVTFRCELEYHETLLALDDRARQENLGMARETRAQEKKPQMPWQP